MSKDSSPKLHAENATLLGWKVENGLNIRSSNNASVLISIFSQFNSCFGFVFLQELASSRKNFVGEVHVRDECSGCVFAEIASQKA